MCNRRSGWRLGRLEVLICRLLGVCAWLATTPGLATPLLGDFAAAYDSPEAAVDNPANAGFLAHSGVSGSAEGLKQETISARYPGLEPIVVKNNNVSLPLAKPGLIVKVTPNLGIGGFAVPPIPYTFSVSKPHLPVILLGQPFYLDAKIKAQLQGLGNFIVGYRLNETFGLGFGVDYTAVKFSALLSESQTGTTLVSADGSATLINANIGARVQLAGGRVSVGIATTALQMRQVQLDVSSPLINGGSAGDALKSVSSGLNMQRQFGGALAGVRLKLVPRITVMGEVRYSRSDPNQQSVSVVNLKKEAVDARDVIAFRGGLVVSVAPRINLLGGFRYEPSPIGPGRLGDDPRVGFGTADFLSSVAGFAPLGEYYMVGGGLQLGVLQAAHQKSNQSDYWRLIIEGGVTFTEASIGIDESGELPGAYYYRKIATVGGLRLNF